MNKLQRQILAGLVAMATGMAASHADTFDFSYTYADAHAVTGSFQGTESGIYVNNIHDIAMAFDGHPTSGTIYAATYSSGSFVPGPVVSFQATANDFIFINSDILHGDFGFTDGFFIAPPAYFATPTAQVDSSSATFGETKAIIPANWKLQDVPDGGATFALFGSALTGLALFRRRLAGI